MVELSASSLFKLIKVPVTRKSLARTRANIRPQVYLSLKVRKTIIKIISSLSNLNISFED